MQNTVKVGVFMTISLLVLGYLILRAEQIRLFAPKGERVAAQFDSVAGLNDQSTVRIAGVRVGMVDGIDLVGSAALVKMLLEREVALTEGTYAEIKNLGLLGDKYVELVPGPPGGKPLPPNAIIPGKASVTMDQVMSSIGNLGSSLQNVADQLSGRAPADGPLGRLVVNLETTSAQIRDLIAANRDQLTSTIGNFEQVSATLAQELPKLSEQLAGLLSEVRAVVAENRGTMKQGLENVEQLTSNLQTSVDNLNQISGKIARGEGTIGKLVNDETAHDELVTTLQSVKGGVDSLSSTLGRVNKLQLDLSMSGYYLADSPYAESAHGELMVDIDPQSGKLYRVGVIDDPAGRRRSKTQTITTTNPDGTVDVETIETATLENDTTLSAMFGVPVGERYRLWAGLMESRFGVQVEYKPADRWFLSAQAYDFSRPDDLLPHVRVTAGYRPLEHIYVLGGYDDVLEGDYGSLFLGAGIRWRDDDLKYLLGSVPKF